MQTRPLWDPDQRYIDQRIKCAIVGLIYQYGLTPTDIEDLRQEFILDLLKRLKAFRPEKAARRTFISRLVQNHARTIVEFRTAQIRDVRQNADSLDKEIEEGDLDGETKLDQLSNDDYKAWFGYGSSTDEDLLDLSLDLKSAVGKLPPRQRSICEALSKEQTKTEIARALKVSRATVHADIQVIRRRLVRAGIETGKIIRHSDPASGM